MATIDGQYRDFQNSKDASAQQRLSSQLQQEISNVRWDVDDLEKALSDIKAAPERYKGVSMQDIDARQLYINQQRQKLNQIQNSLSISKSSKPTKGGGAGFDGDASLNIKELQRQEQAQAIKEQDQVLDRFHVTVSQIGNISRTIGDELEDQNRILHEFDYEVDDTHSRLGTATKFVDKLLENVSNNKSWCAILILFAILVVVIIIAFAL